MLLVTAVLVSFTLILAILIFIIKIFLSKIKLTRLSERYVFITGCDTGFGNLLARTLDAAGVNVIAGCLTEHGAKGLAQVASSTLKTVVVDITDKESVKRAFDFTKSVVGETGLWGLVNNAGVMPTFGPAEWTPVEDFEAVCKVNLFGTISVTLTFLPLLRLSRGRLVTVCSVVSNCAFPGIANYSISKAGVKMFTQCIRRELLNSGVSAHIIEPGGFQTNITNKNRLISMLQDAYIRAPPETRPFYQGNICNYVFHDMELQTKYVTGKPQSVADAMAHALLAKYPKMRYVVGLDANTFFRLLNILPEWAADHIIGWPAPYGNLSKHLQECNIKED